MSAKNFEVMWTPWDERGLEHLRLRIGESPIEADGVVVLSLQSGYHRALMTIEAASGRSNPFVTRRWRQFGCGA